MVIHKLYASNFEIFICLNLITVQHLKFFPKISNKCEDILTSKPWNIKNENLKNPCTKFCITLKSTYMKRFGSLWIVVFSEYPNLCQIWLFFYKVQFPYILYYQPHVNACKTKSLNDWETYDPIFERRKIGLQHIWKWTKSIFWGARHPLYP